MCIILQWPYFSLSLFLSPSPPPLSLFLSLSLLLLAPDGSPEVLNHTSPYLDDYNQINLFWRGIGDNLWNGINNTYVVDMFDVTVDVRQNNRLRFSVSRSSQDIYNQVITDLEVREQFVVIEERKGEVEGD